MKNKVLLLCLSLFAVLAGASAAQAVGIDDVDKYSWSESAGYFDWKSGMGDAVDADQEQVRGHVWGEQIGWVYLGSAAVPPAADAQTSNNYGIKVTMNGMEANLSGYVWSENAGWIRFDVPGYDPVKIDANGNFTGYAWSETLGWISMSGANPNYLVKLIQTLRADGDVNNDGEVNNADMNLLAEILNGDYTQEQIDANNWDPDVNNDGNVDILDMAKMIEILNG